MLGMGGQLNLVTRDGAGKSDVIDHYALIAKNPEAGHFFTLARSFILSHSVLTRRRV